MKNLLITGGDGFTGRHLVEAASLYFNITVLKADLMDAEAIALEVQSAIPDYVVHLAAISSVTHVDQEAFYRVNLFGSLNLLAALKRLPKMPEKVLLASSANVYGNVDSNAISEDFCPSPVNHYAMSKLAMEHLACNYLDRLPIIVTRPFNYTGVGHDDRFVIPKIVDHFARRASEIELGNLDVEREYNDVRMVCDAYLRLLEFGRPGDTYNVCSGRSYGLRHVLSMLSDITGHSPNIRINPEFVRNNEVHKLAGSPAKLERAIGKLQKFELKDTLAWMLASKASQLPQ